MTDNRLLKLRFVVDGHTGIRPSPTVFPGPPGEDEENDYIRDIVMTLYGIAEGTATAATLDGPDGGEEAYQDFPKGWVKAGQVRCYLFLGASAMNDGFDIITDLADACGEDEYEAAEAMYSRGAGLIEIDDGVRDSLCHNMLLVHSVWVEPPYRGHEIAQFMIRRAVDYCDHGNLGAVLALPSRDYFERNGTSAELLPAGAKDKKDGLARLRSHFTRMGFHRHPKDRKFLFLRTTPRDMNKLRAAPFKDDLWWRAIFS